MSNAISSSTVNILTADSSSLINGGSLNSLTGQVQARLQTEMAEKQEKTNAALTASTDAINAESDRWITVKAGMLNAKSAFENAEEAITTAQSAMLEMRNQILNSVTDSEYSINLYQTQINTINNMVDGYSKEYNPIGNVDSNTWEPNVIEYRTDLAYGSTSITGTYGGSDFKITAADGTVWRPDLGSSTMRLVGTDGQTEETVSMTKAVTLKSYDENTGAITIEVHVPTEDDATNTVTVSGTLEKAGLGLMPAWYYNNFSSEADRQKAQQDIQNAEAELTLVQSQIVSGKAQVERDEMKADAEVDALTQKRKDAMMDNLKDQQALQVEAQKQYQAMLTNLSNLDSEAARYASVFGSTIANNKLLDAMV